MYPIKCFQFSTISSFIHLLIFLFLSPAGQGRAATALSDGFLVKPCPDHI